MIDAKKLNRILKFIELQGGLTTEELEYIMSLLNRNYIKRLIQADKYIETVNPEFIK